MNKYEELVRELKNRILSGEFPPGGKFPSDFDLAEEYGVSKLTVNKAVSILACDGFIRRGIRRWDRRFPACSASPACGDT